MADQQAPAGWYDDGSGTGTQRYWDGGAWTPHTAPATPTAAAQEPAPTTRRSRAPLIGGIALVAVTAVVAGGIFAWGPISAVLNPPGVLSDAAFYEMSVENLEEVKSADIPAIAFPDFDNFRRSPGFRAAVNEFIDAEVARLDGTMTFGSQEDADEYAYSTIYAGVVDLEANVRRGGIDTPLATRSFPQADEIVAIEQEIAAMPIAPGADGTYWESAERVAAVAGSTITRDETLSTCIDFDIDFESAAFFCGNEEVWDYVFFTPAGVAGEMYPSLVDVTKHELAHKLIAVQCQGALGLGQATWHGQYGEGVTNSYAVIYLGADPANLFQGEDYAMNAETDAKARAVHDGDLACYDGGVLPAG